MFNLTPEERRVIVFLAGFALLGLGGNFLVKALTGVKGVASFSHDLGKINLNTADRQTLMCVRGIGEKLAGRIIDYRNEQGSFRSLLELKNIKGITDSKYGKIKEDLFV